MQKMNREFHIIFPSSGGSVYYPSKSFKPKKESNRLLSETSYGIQKIAIENYLRIAVKNGLIKATVLRISNPYGVLLPTYRKQGFIGVALHKIKKNEPVQIFGDINNVRDYIHLDDVVNAFKIAVDRQGPIFDVFNIGSGKGYSVKQILEIIEQYLNRLISIEHVFQKGSERLPPYSVLDITKAQKRLNWQPHVSLEKGLKALMIKANILS